MKKVAPFLSLLILLIPGLASAAPNASKIPIFWIQSVAEDQTVTIVTENFPASDNFTVTMGYMGTRGVNGYVVGTQDSGAGGSFSATYDIPAHLMGQYRIAIRLQSPTSGYYAYNWFYNNTATVTVPPGSADPGPPVQPPPASPPPFTIPTFKIDAVTRNDNVTITTQNFPANDSFTVRMNYMGTLGIGGWVVTTQDSGAGGSFTATYDIPSQLMGQYRIAIRLESPTSGYYSYNWFYNNTTP